MSRELKLRVDGQRFASAYGVAANLVLPVTSNPTEAVVVMDDGRILVRALLIPKNVDLYVPKPTALLGVVTPKADTRLAWESSSADSVRVGLDTDRELRAPRPFQADLPCGDVVIIEPSYDARASITKAKKLAKRDVIKDGAALAPARGASPVAELNLDVQVELVEMKGKDARILIDGAFHVVSGWVAQKDLGPASAIGHGIGYGKGTGMVAGQRGIRNLPRCSSDVSLYVEHDSRRVKIGSIKKGKGFRPKSDTDDRAEFREIDLPDSPWFVPEKNARLLVNSAETRECHAESPGF
jgi:hypothetical protein